MIFNPGFENLYLNLISCFSHILPGAARGGVNPTLEGGPGPQGGPGGPLRLEKKRERKGRKRKKREEKKRRGKKEGRKKEEKRRKKEEKKKKKRKEKRMKSGL